MRDRLPSLIEEISRIGSDRTPSEVETSPDNAFNLRSPEDENTDISTSGVLEKDRKNKQIVEYPRPHAVVGASVL